MNDTTSRRIPILIAATILSTVLAITALAVAIVAISKDQKDSKRIGTLQTQLRAAAPALSSASSGIAAQEAKLKTLEGKVSKIAPEVASIESCLPELQSELGSLEIKGETYALSYISNPAHTSLACNKVLYTSGR